MSRIEQMALLQDGPLAGKMASIAFPKPFFTGMGVQTPHGEYVVRKGPIAQCIEKSQEPVEFGAVVLMCRQTLSEEDERWVTEVRYAHEVQRN